MFDAKQLESLAKRIADAIPPGMGEVPSNVKAQIKTILMRNFEKMDLVSREEFDLQTQVLAKTRQKLEALEKVVAELESNSGRSE